MDDEEAVDRLVHKMAERAQHIGLYLDVAAVRTLEEDPSTVVVVGTYLVGERAFSTQVQDPEQHRFNEEFRGMRLEVEQEERQRLRDEIRGWMGDDDDE